MSPWSAVSSASRGGRTRGPDQPEHGVDEADGDAHSGGEGRGFGKCPEQVGAGQAEQRAADDGQQGGGRIEKPGRRFRGERGGGGGGELRHLRAGREAQRDFHAGYARPKILDVVGQRVPLGLRQGNLL